MAIKKVVDIKNSGVIAEYWRIVFFSINWDDGQGCIALSGYLNKYARDSNKNPVPGASISIALNYDDIKTLESMDTIPGKRNMKEVDLTRLYYFLRTQRVKNPLHALVKGESETEYGEFAGDESEDIL